MDMGAETGKAPEEAGGEGSASLFDASGDARVRVLRKDERTQKMVTHGFFPPTVSEEDVMEAFGGGHYRAQLVIQDGSGLSKIKTQRDFNIPGAYKPPQEIPAFRSGVEGPKNPPIAGAPVVGTIPPGMGDMAGMLNATMMTTFMDMIKTMKEVSTRPAPTIDPLLVALMQNQSATQGKMMELLLGLMTRPTGESAEKGEERTLRLLASMREIIAPSNAADPLAMFNKVLESFGAMREAAEDFTPQRSGSGDPLMDSIPKLAEVIAGEYQQRQAARNRIPAPNTPALPPGAPIVDAAQPPAEPLPIWKQLLRREGPRLSGAAASGKSAELMADIAVAFMPENIKGAIVEFFHRDEKEVFADIVAEVPTLAQFPTWVADFVEHAQFKLFPEEFTDDAPEAPQAEEPAP
ncbi:MAG: hypothetical protein ACRDRF_00710 [Pseudonocardiaceae bacterium]